MTDYYTRSDCRLCGSQLKTAFSLASTPPANELVTKEYVESEQIQDTFPLFISVCTQCGHVQLPVVVDPERLFRNYVYTSGGSLVFIKHLRKYADDIIARFDVQPNDLVIEIGSNDGVLLQRFQEHGIRVLGVDPAKNIAEIAESNGVKTIADFFTYKLAKDIRDEYGLAKIIIANNVFAHSDYLDDMTLGIRELLTSEGIFVFEVSYLMDVIEGTLFDTIYHEHLSYHHLSPLLNFFQKFGLSLFDAERVDSQGGSIRGYVGYANQLTDRLVTQIGKETNFGLRTCLNYHFDGMAPLLHLENKINSLKADLLEKLHEIKANGKRIAGFGAPAKCTTLTHHFEFGSDLIDYIVDDSPIKCGLFTPGKYLEILPTEEIYKRKPDYIIIFVWNFAESIIQRHQKFLDMGGKFIVPMPEIVIYE